MRILLLLTSVVVACGGGEEGPDPLCEEATMNQSFDWIVDNIFLESCVSSQCHGGTDPEEGLDLRANVAYSEIVGQSSVQQTGLNLIEPGDPANSYLYIKIGGGNQAMLLEEPMPNDDPPLCDEKVDAIRRWIEAGAPQ